MMGQDKRIEIGTNVYSLDSQMSFLFEFGFGGFTYHQTVKVVFFVNIPQDFKNCAKTAKESK